MASLTYHAPVSLCFASHSDIGEETEQKDIEVGYRVVQSLATERVFCSCVCVCVCRDTVIFTRNAKLFFFFCSFCVIHLTTNLISCWATMG